MKKLALLLLIISFTSNQLIAQNPFSQSKILELNHYNYKASDFGITNTKNVVKINEKEYTKNLDRILELNETTNYSVIKGKITNRDYIGKYYSSLSDYVYNKNYSILEKRVYTDSENGEEIDFKFDKKRRLIEVITSFKKKGTSTTQLVEYNDANNTIERYVLGVDGNRKLTLSFKTNKDGNVISKTEKGSQLYPEDKNRFYTYDGNNIISISKNETIDNVVQVNSEASSNFLFNDKGLITTYKGDLSITDYSFDRNNIYEYIYDKYGNWIVRYVFSRRYGYLDLEEENYKGISSLTMRKLTYKNGDVTGNTNMDSNSVQNYLEEIYTNNPFKTKTAPKTGNYWTRTSERGVKLYSNGTYIGNQSNILIILEDDFYANDSINNVFYKLKDFKQKPTEKAFYEANVFASNDEVVWFRSNDKAIKAYKNGRILTSKLNYFKTFGDHFYINDSTTNNFYQLKDFGSKQIDGAFYKAIPIANHNDVIWVKLDNGNYTILKNGVNITTSIKMVYAKNETDVLIKENDIPKYAMINAKNITAGSFYKAVPYSQYVIENPNEGKKEEIPDGLLWKKNEQDQFYIYRDGKVDPSNIKVIGFYNHQFVYDVDHNISYVLENFENRNANQYYTINVLEGNMFFYKTSDAKIGIIKNGVTIDFKNSVYASNQIDVKSYDNNDIDVYILLNYKNISTLTLGKVINAKDYTED